MTEEEIKVLFIEDDEKLTSRYERKLGKYFKLFTANNGDEGLKIIKRYGPFAVVVSDMKMPGLDGIDFISCVRKLAPDTIRIMITGFADMDSTIDAINEGYIFRFLTKPCRTEKLIKAIKDGIRQYRLIKLEKELNKKLIDEIEKRKKIEAELKKANIELKRLSREDPLTKIYNRRYFMHLLEKEFKRSKRYSTPLSIMMLDIDFFKKINDTYGHQVGDKVLVKLASIMKNNMREVDIIGRYGGEEFCIVMPETSLKNAVHAAEKLRELILITEFRENDFPKAIQSLKITCSIGIAELSDNIIGIKDFINLADKALYKAKGTGRNKVVIQE